MGEGKIDRERERDLGAYFLRLFSGVFVPHCLAFLPLPFLYVAGHTPSFFACRRPSRCLPFSLSCGDSALSIYLRTHRTYTQSFSFCRSPTRTRAFVAFTQKSVGTSVPEWTHPALTELETAVRDDKVAHKNTAILLEAQVAVRRLCGGRVTFCKSGKVCLCVCALCGV